MKSRIVGWRIAVGGAVLFGLAFPSGIFAQQCPPELAQANSKIAAVKAGLAKTTAQTKDVSAPRSAAGYRGDAQAPRGQEPVQAPRGQEPVQAPRGQEPVQAPRGQEPVQAPRGQEPVQAPRGQEPVQAPRGQEPVQAPRGQEPVQAPRAAAGARAQAPMQKKLELASGLAAESERACKAGNMALSSQKAKAALEALK